MFFTKRLQTNTMLQHFIGLTAEKSKKIKSLGFLARSAISMPQRFIGLTAEKSKKIKKSLISRAKRDQYATTFYRPNGREIKKNKKVLDFSREAQSVCYNVLSA